uniref:ABC transporter domain-containing protein n=1 Tax=Noctiluca scintillans TaxID=2966 RepID=A0A7S0ZQK2_NOCSC|eukprot:CAMPEP_0194541014 /NCGR_PEP_ID=MMETSP0253-20130528/81540_1 /TAXON_ID=2966 /ORGANISM="Noctiluca scintillans" /LENGTH=609 /DNA_ID=CAMNT_0039387457 /DNA_START=6 /DNA_END=1835 /DNA_ORIENTATION=+
MSRSQLNDTLLMDDLEACQGSALDLKRVTYDVPGKPHRRTLLSNITCSFPAGKPTAIMGASGSGKTTLLTLLRGLRSPGAALSGEILCGGDKVTPTLMRAVSSFVPQEGTFLAGLTVRESLGFAAELRLSRKIKEIERTNRIENMLQSVRLTVCADTLVGDEQMGVRGISSGERKRLSIAMSLIGGFPRVLFIDEPTSGLDAASATNIVHLLRDLSARGVTVLCSIHQPSHQMLCAFEQLLLMQSGSTIFWGKVADVEEHFAAELAPTPRHTNPADHYLALLEQDESAWKKAWEAKHPVSVNSSSPKVARPVRVSWCAMSKSGLTAWEQVCILTRRNVMENFHNRKKFLKGLVVRLPTAISTGFIFRGFASHATQESIFPLHGVFLIVVQNVMIESFYGGALTFQQARGLLRREYYDGLYTALPFYIAYFAGFASMQVPWTLCSTVPIYLLVGFSLEYHRFALFATTVFVIILMTCIWGTCIGASTRDQTEARGRLVPAILLMSTFSGYVIPFQQIPWYFMPFYYLSPMQWGMAILRRTHFQGKEFVDCDSSVPASRRNCFATGEELLASEPSGAYSTTEMFGFCLLYILFFVVLNLYVVKKHVLDGRV